MQFKEPEFVMDPHFSELRFTLKRREKDEKYLTLYDLKDISKDPTLYLCENCTNRFMGLLRDFGFRRLVSKVYFGDNKEIEL